MIDYYKMAFEKYADFSSRATRPEFWYFYLVNILIAFALFALAFVGMDFASGDMSMMSKIGFGLIVLYTLATVIPTLAICVRRLHDTGRSGWWYFISFIPYIGAFILIFFWAQETKSGANKWGPDPNATDLDDLEDALVNFD